jgi:hypothetical protein
MPERPEHLHARVEALAEEVRRLRERLEVLEARLAPEAAAPGPSQAPLPAGGDAVAVLPPGMVALSGRTLVALGGGYLIRALTEAGGLPALAGVGLGLAYAIAWLVLADRAAAGGQRVSAAFHGLTSALIAYPLLWETTVRFGLLTPSVALAFLLCVLAAGIAVARRRRLGVLAWLSVGLALATSAGLFVATFHLLAALAALLGIAGIVEWMADHDLWLGLRWPAALILDAALLATIVLIARPEGLPEGYPPAPWFLAVALALATPAIYVSAIVDRTLRRMCPVRPFEVIQGTAALVLGFGGAWRLLGSQPAAAALGLFCLVLGALGYAAAFAFIERREGHNRNFYFYSSVGGVLTLAGSRAILGPILLTLALCLLAGGAAGLGRWFERTTLQVHGALYACVAAVETGLAWESWSALVGPRSGAWTLPTPAGWIAAVAAWAAYALLAGRWRGKERGAAALLPRAISAAAAVLILGGILVAGFATGAGSLSPAGIATLRTGTLALLALGLGLAARRWVLRELTWFVYPLLAVGGVKLATQDLWQGRALTLFLSLVLYGTALIAAPRLLRHEP